MDDRRFSIASSHYSQSQETYDSHSHEDSSQLISAPSRPPLVPRRSSLRVSQARLSTIPASPLHVLHAENREYPTNSGAPSPASSSSSAFQGSSALPTPHTSTQAPLLPQRQSHGWSGQFRPLSSVDGPFPTLGRENHRSQARGPPQPAFLLPFETDVSLRSKSSISDLSDLDRYYGTLPQNHKPHAHQLASTYSLDPDPAHWGTKLKLEDIEPDDDLHNPDPERDRKQDTRRGISTRAMINVGCLAILITGLIALFAGYPLIVYFTQSQASTLGAYNLGGINASGQVPDIPSHRGLIDVDTPKSAYTRTSLVDGSKYELVFSDEFNVEGRSFYPGDDPYWEAVDLHYWSTNNIEWYDPAQVTTASGSLRIELSAKQEHNLNYTGGMLSSWNKFCFTGGYIEANVSLPGSSKTYGLWPAVWTMGNLGRAGYGASLEGTWPYTYNSCDVGTLANQTDPVTNGPAAAHTGGVSSSKGEMSYLPGQRLSACTCTSESDGTDGQQMVHPGPKVNGQYVGRSAPEIDVFEAQVEQHTLVGAVSQSGQWAPFNAAFVWDNSSTNLIISDPANSKLNTFVGNEWQQTTSVVTNTNQNCYTQEGGCFSTYGFEYKPGNDGYIQWVNDDKMVWEIKGAGMGADSKTQISQRPVPEEPMYILANLGMSYNFGPIDFEHLVFPAYMLVDYIRVYQPADQQNIGCDPPDFPTANYINTYIEAYTNPNITTWVDDYKQRMPKNRLIDQC
ncbi:Beta-glucan synthesis-associated protein KRE6 OS=Saccharomyces cerevisiae (strain ATCC 204508 / S288c) GN=KRE6 PE=1 SV=2 [Rhizoctonia solani AG-1 IB]|uniref:Beta-glucan synthesis-associated protein KRE6 n=1 Tax=Thanatephorus cucumeris (strain AG1-IB / isolate 7/3/14) TaxID=1108050 RepID=A0A0B7FLF3_THACB|nr:Beta-glucan synthesis-associated protein KRE6 OS=Saccharomyces cerevisiae (strain ATCC 204508 / S288c) GN=KRE6 PE=1 SV=2 [Rhizoctonia solani AG-1 IB]